MLYSVMLVEDEKWVRKALMKVIEKSGLPLKVVHEAADGVNAADWLKSHEADLVMTDIRMPVMDGLTLLKEMKEQRITADVVMVSGHDDFTYAKQAIRLGAVDYLLKPVETADLTDCIGNWLEKKQDRTEGRMPVSDRSIKIQELSPINQVVHYIESNMAFDMTSCEAAEMVHLNPSYFSKLFKSSMSMTFTEYMTKVRMKEAGRLLQRTSLRVHEVAERVGFVDIAYFSNTFKRVTGLSPREFRKEMGK